MLILTRGDTDGLLDLEACIPVVEAAFAERGRGSGLDAKRFHVSAGPGAFHVTAGGVGQSVGGPVFGIKMNGRFPPSALGQGQRVTGAILLADGESGQPLALLDSLAVTIVRTAAVTAVATRHLARADARTALIVGAGTQASLQLAALQLARAIEEITVCDVVPEKAEALATQARDRGLRASVAADPDRAAQSADIVVTVTPASVPVITQPPPGSTIIALGADGPGKRELGPKVMGESKVIVDVLDQAAYAGELASALQDGVMKRADVHAELGEVLAGTKPGRTNADETIVFDATGTALQDVAASLLIVDAARRAGRGVELNLTD